MMRLARLLETITTVLALCLVVLGVVWLYVA